jgi:hypothetical protein
MKQVLTITLWITVIVVATTQFMTTRLLRGGEITVTALAGAAVAQEAGTTLVPVSLEVSSPTEELTTLAVRTHNEHTNPTVYVYYDSRYPALQVSEHGALGLIDHLEREFVALDQKVTLEVVDADKLAAIVSSGDTDPVIIMASGVLPETVYPKGAEPTIAKWVRDGGRLIWAGEPIGYYRGLKDKLDFNDVEAIRETMTKQIMGADYFWGAPFPEWDISSASDQTDIGKALNLSYNWVRTGAEVHTVKDNGGVVLGRTKTFDDGTIRTSIALIPIGKGNMTVFGAGVFNQEVQLAEDITRIIASQIIWAENSIASKSLTFEMGRPLTYIVDSVGPADAKVIHITLIAHGKLHSQYKTLDLSL